MKKVRRGFTLVELLIVIAILGALSATMSVATSGSTAKAKAAAIAANVEACKSAAVLYVNDEDKEVTGKKADDVLKDMIPTWVDFNEGDTKYEGTDDTTSDKWAITVDFNEEKDKDSIRDALKKIKGYGKYTKSDGTIGNVLGSTNKYYKFKVTLLSGKIETVK